tara:strand:+ start:460 stop:564 length:105 start_codon:yes stop_codon:yes gene_type:complete
MKSDYLEIWLNGRKSDLFFESSGALSTALEKPRE